MGEGRARPPNRFSCISGRHLNVHLSSASTPPHSEPLYVTSQPMADRGDTRCPPLYIGLKISGVNVIFSQWTCIWSGTYSLRCMENEVGKLSLGSAASASLTQLLGIGYHLTCSAVQTLMVLRKKNSRLFLFRLVLINSKLVPFESLGVVSYSPSIVTMAVSLTVYEIFSGKE